MPRVRDGFSIPPGAARGERGGGIDRCVLFLLTELSALRSLLPPLHYRHRESKSFPFPTGPVLSFYRPLGLGDRFDPSACVISSSTPLFLRLARRSLHTTSPPFSNTRIRRLTAPAAEVRYRIPRKATLPALHLRTGIICPHPKPQRLDANVYLVLGAALFHTSGTPEILLRLARLMHPYVVVSYGS